VAEQLGDRVSICRYGESGYRCIIAVPSRVERDRSIDDVAEGRTSECAGHGSRKAAVVQLRNSDGIVSTPTILAHPAKLRRWRLQGRQENTTY